MIYDTLTFLPCVNTCSTFDTEAGGGASWSSTIIVDSTMINKPSKGEVLVVEVECVLRVFSLNQKASLIPNLKCFFQQVSCLRVRMENCFVLDI